MQLIVRVEVVIRQNRYAGGDSFMFVGFREKLPVNIVFLREILLIWDLFIQRSW